MVRQRANNQSEIHPDISPTMATTTLQEEVTLPIDVNSTIASDISKIWHVPETNQICVALKQDANCPRPALLGRLSGPSLAILEWGQVKESSDGSGGGTTLCGSYGHYWLDAGDYFVEIIILFCQDFGVNSLERTNNITAWLETDRAETCVEDATKHRITAKTTQTIRISKSLQGRDNYRFGRWVRRPDCFPSKPLYQRSQPILCAPKSLGGVKHPEGSAMYNLCKELTGRDSTGGKSKNRTGIFEYDFQWRMKDNATQVDLVNALRQRLPQKDPKVCAIGDSHSRYMIEKSLPRLELDGLFGYIRSQWIEPDSIFEKIGKRKCDTFFIQVGQHPSSRLTEGHPFSFGKYHDKLKLHVQNILKRKPNAQIYLPTLDQGPIIATVLHCEDWRTPTYLDSYTYVHQMIAREINEERKTEQVKYIDINHVIYPTFDSHRDWQHLMEMVRSRKTLYMAAVMLGMTEWFEE